MQGIVVGIDGSQGAALALRWALDEGQHRGWPVTAVMAWNYLDQQDSGTFDPSYDEADAKATLEAALDEALGPDATVGQEVICGLPAQVLRDAAEGADLLVVGARGMGGFRGLLLGSVSQRVLHDPSCPVAVIRVSQAPGRGAQRRIVVGVDGSPTSQAALGWALDEARAWGASVEAVHAWRLPYIGGYPFSPATLDARAIEDAAHEVLATAVDRADTRGLPVPVERIVVMGGASRAILDTAEGADLVVVGSRGLGGFGGVVLGSVSHQVVHHSTCPVVVVPSTA